MPEQGASTFEDSAPAAHGIPGLSFEGWRQYTSPEGRRYFHHAPSKTTQWALPPGFLDSSADAAPCARGPHGLASPALLAHAAEGSSSEGGAGGSAPHATAHHLCEHNRQRSKCMECNPGVDKQAALALGANQLNVQPPPRGLGAQADADATTAASAPVPSGARGPHNKEPQISRRLGWKYAPQEWVDSHPAAHTEHYWFCLGATRQRQIRDEYRLNASGQTQLSWALAPKKWAEKTPDSKTLWNTMTGEEQCAIRDNPEFQDKRPYAKAPTIWKRQPEHTEEYWVSLSAEEQFDIVKDGKWRRRSDAASPLGKGHYQVSFPSPYTLLFVCEIVFTREHRRRNLPPHLYACLPYLQLKFFKSPLLWRASDPSKHTPEHWHALTQTQQQDIKKNTVPFSFFGGMLEISFLLCLCLFVAPHMCPCTHMFVHASLQNAPPMIMCSPMFMFSPMIIFSLNIFGGTGPCHRGGTGHSCRCCTGQSDRSVGKGLSPFLGPYGTLLSTVRLRKFRQRKATITREKEKK